MRGFCAGITRGGERCSQSVKPGQQYCHRHDPAKAEERKRAASKAGKSKPSREIRDLKQQLEALAEDVLEGRVDRADATTVNQIINTRARLIALERDIREQEELEQRITLLEQAAQSRGGRSWAT